MFHTLADFLSLWKEETENTVKLFNAITEKSFEAAPKDDARSIKQLTWHIVESPKEMLERTGLKIAGATNRTETVASVQQLTNELQKVAESVHHQIQSHWNNKSLHQTDDMYGQEWTRNKTLTILLHHMIHHRGQLTILMRQAGIAVPGMYGPAKEEWAMYGMQTPVEE